jgi:hypothetical protein
MTAKQFTSRRSSENNAALIEATNGSDSEKLAMLACQPMRHHHNGGVSIASYCVGSG